MCTKLSELDRLIGKRNSKNQGLLSFSDADINSLAMGMKELRASAKEGNYSMKATKTADPVGFHQAYERAASSLQTKMRKVAEQMVAGRWKNYEAYRKENRKAQCQILHGWYAKNAECFGYTYSFGPNGDYK